MKFKTEINLDPAKFRINHSDTIFTIGSCFAENIADRFHSYKFNVLKNPFGVLYNPVSIYNGLKLAIENKTFTEDDLVFEQDEWHSFYHHSDFSHHDPGTALTNINEGMAEARDFLGSADIIIITYGTSFIYKYKTTGETVSNCHKIPAAKFERSMLELNEVENTVEKTVELLQNFNPRLKIVFTVSPVRHWKDGASDNQLSKGKLLLGLQKQLSDNNITYFPSYEIMLDDLRDYRYYAEDLLHPSQLAVDYIWGKFTASYFDETNIQLLKKIEKIKSAYNHRPRNTASPKHQQFLKQNIESINKLINDYPHINFDTEKKYFEELII